MKTYFTCALVACVLAVPQARATEASSTLATRLLYWNSAALRANAIDHALPPGSNPSQADQFGPPRSARALAIVHLAMFDAANAVLRRYPSYSGMAAAPGDSSADAAVARAAHDTLAALYPAQAATFASAYAADMRSVADGRAKYNGVETGRLAAAGLLSMSAYASADYGDGIAGVNFFPSNAPGKWRPDPVSRSPLAVGAFYGGVRPFLIPATRFFAPPAPPALTSAAYTSAFHEVRQLGGDGMRTPTRRTSEQTIAGIYWGYDGTPYLGTPPRLYNQIAVHIARQRKVPPMELARMLAMVNAAMADTCLVVWEAKYRYQYWRPVTAIREADPGSGPSGQGDGNPNTRGAALWTPLGSPASNTSLPDFTPPFPAYPSGHASFGSAMFQVLRRLYGTDAIAFTFVSDEYNGITRDNDGRVRPRLPRSFASLSQAEEENGRSRIYLGVHWSFDHSGGSYVGRRVADYIVDHGLLHP